RFLSLVAGDTARLLVNGATIWSTSSATYDQEWQWIEHDVSAQTNAAAQVVIRFELQTTSTNAAGGWKLDDVELSTLHDAAPPVEYGAGTPGTGNVVPVLALAAPALLGTTTQFHCSAMFPNGAALLVLNFQPADVPALGIQVL